MRPTVKIVLDKRRADDDGLFPVKLRVTFERAYRKYRCSIENMSDEKFQRIIHPSARGVNKDILLRFQYIENKALSIIDDMDEFTFDEFKILWLNPKKHRKSLSALFDLYINRLRSQERHGSADAFDVSKKSFDKFDDKATIDKIDVNWLIGYERWMVEQGRTVGTVGINCRSLRAVYNEAIFKKLVKQDKYPFGKRGYVIPSARKRKNALKLSEIKKLYNYQPKLPSHRYAIDLFLLSYFMGGANIGDIARLRFKHIDHENGVISFVRGKTKRKVKDAIHIPLSSEIGKILDRITMKGDFKPDDYLLPILDLKMGEQDCLKMINSTISNINKKYKIIAEKLEIPRFSHNVARHSFATVMKNSGVSMAFIQESLGHQSSKTTEIYMSGFEMDAKKKAMDLLTQFDIED